MYQNGQNRSNRPKYPEGTIPGGHSIVSPLSAISLPLVNVYAAEERCLPFQGTLNQAFLAGWLRRRVAQE